MNWFGSGFITIINYASTADIIIEQNALLTENSFDILAENGDLILIDD